MKETEFDAIADDYHAQHARNIAGSGESPEYFHNYKIADAAAICRRYGVGAKAILDFGSGIGNSIPAMREHFPAAALTCADVSQRSLDLSKSRYPGPEVAALIAGETLPFEDESFDLAFSACVFHHIPHEEHAVWLRELRRVTKRGGLLVIFEHNPWNPLTVRAVNTCPFDVNARLIAAPALKASVAAAGYEPLATWYRIFFPRGLAALRPLEKLMHGLPVGAQYCAIARR